MTQRRSIDRFAGRSIAEIVELLPGLLPANGEEVAYEAPRLGSDPQFFDRVVQAVHILADTGIVGYSTEREAGHVSAIIVGLTAGVVRGIQQGTRGPNDPIFRAVVDGPGQTWVVTRFPRTFGEKGVPLQYRGIGFEEAVIVRANAELDALTNDDLVQLLKQALADRDAEERRSSTDTYASEAAEQLAAATREGEHRGEATLVIAWNPAVITPSEYAELVEILGNLARLEGGSGIHRIKSQGLEVPVAEETAV